MATTGFKPKVYIHLIRHGQSQHNYSAIQYSKDQNYDPKNADKSEWARCKSVRDPGLTPHGINEAIDLRHRFPYMDKITHILTSPLRRTLQTMFLGFEPAIKRGIKPIALDILRETGFGPNHFGSDLPSLLAEFGELGESVITTEIEPGWEIPQVVRSPIEISRRRNLVLSRLRELSNLAKMSESELNQAKKDFEELDPDTRSPFNMWLMKYDFPRLREGKDVHIAVVTHGNFLKWMTFGEGVLFDNAEFRTFMFKGEEEGGPDPKADQSLHLVEMKESKDRPEAWLCEADLVEKLRMREEWSGRGGC
ncbi:histidine phosphatase superfamily [Leptodontidium sp. 2 PMI_412]|nr:histidine phosphatase superfamily [Leptodontidium sp. 2 PMI_412]